MTEPTLTQLYQETAAVLAAQLPQQLLTRVMEEQLKESFRSLLGRWNTGPTLEKLVDAAVQERISELLRTTYKDQVDAVANTLAIEAIGLARRDLRVARKER